MKYNININQLALSKSKLDLKDSAILEYLRAFCSVDDKRIKQLTITEDGRDYRYTWINYKHLIDEMPLLKIKQKASISTRIKKIEKAGYIKTFKAPDNTIYVRLLDKILELEFEGKETPTVSKNKQGYKYKQTGVLAKTNSTNILSYKHTINKNIAKQSFAGLNDLIDLFKGVNPNYQSLFGNKTERKALEWLVDQHGADKIEAAIRSLPEIIVMPYAPKITKPTELKRNLGKLIAFYRQEKNKSKVKIIL